MPGFMSSNSAMTICKCPAPGPLNVEALRKGAFTDAVDPEGKRFGWVGMNDLLDTENFFLATSDTRFSGFSYRLDARKPSSAVLRLQLAEKIRDEEMQGKKVGAQRKKELRDALLARLTSQADFVPGMTDCIWDGETGNLFVGTNSEKTLERILAHFKGCFGLAPTPLAPERDMAAIFSTIQNEGSLNAGGYILQPMGSASLHSAAASEERSAIAVRNSPDAVSEALNQGLAISRISLVAMQRDNDDEELHFTLDTALQVSALKFPKAGKGAEEEATFLINAEICAAVARIACDLGGSGCQFL